MKKVINYVSVPVSIEPEARYLKIFVPEGREREFDALAHEYRGTKVQQFEYIKQEIPKPTKFMLTGASHPSISYSNSKTIKDGPFASVAEALTHAEKYLPGVEPALLRDFMHNLYISTYVPDPPNGKLVVNLDVRAVWEGGSGA